MQLSHAGQRKILTGLAFALIAAAFYGGSSVIAKKAMTEEDIPPVVFTSFSLLMGVAIVFILFHRRYNFRDRIPRKYLGFIMAAGITSGCAVTLLASAVSRAPIAVVTPLAFLNPLVTLILAHFFLQKLERITPRIVLGTVFAVSGVILVVLGSVQL